MALTGVRLDEGLDREGRDGMTILNMEGQGPGQIFAIPLPTNIDLHVNYTGLKENTSNTSKAYL